MLSVLSQQKAISKSVSPRNIDFMRTANTVMWIWRNVCRRSGTASTISLLSLSTTGRHQTRAAKINSKYRIKYAKSSHANRHVFVYLVLAPRKRLRALKAQWVGGRNANANMEFIATACHNIANIGENLRTGNKNSNSHVKNDKLWVSGRIRRQAITSFNKQRSERRTWADSQA